jgi:hypothetical protein
MFNKSISTGKILSVCKLEKTYVISFRRQAEHLLMPAEHLIGNALGAASYLSQLQLENPGQLPQAIRNAFETHLAKTSRKNAHTIIASEFPVLALYRGGTTTVSMVLSCDAQHLALTEATVNRGLWAWWFDENTFQWILQHENIIRKLPINPTIKETFNHVMATASLLTLLGNGAIITDKGRK